jgi:hypothetical protein
MNGHTKQELVGVATTITSLAAFVLGANRLAGAILAGSGTYLLVRDGKRMPILGATQLAIGASFLLWPDWPTRREGA